MSKYYEVVTTRRDKKGNWGDEYTDYRGGNLSDAMNVYERLVCRREHDANFNNIITNDLIEVRDVKIPDDIDGNDLNAVDEFFDNQISIDYTAVALNEGV